MPKPSRHSQARTSGSGSEHERSPLLPRTEQGHESDDDIPKKGIKAWLAAQAVLVSMSLLILTVVGILCIYLGVYESQYRQNNGTLCTTAACVHAASTILYSLSPKYQTLDPCTDFEEMVCSGWSERHDLRPDQGDAFTGTIMAENSQMLLRHILEAPYPSESKHSSFSPAQLMASLASDDQNNFEKLKAAYDACMDETFIRDKGLKPLRNLLEQVTEVFGAQESAIQGRSGHLNGADNALTKTVLFLTKLGVTSLVNLGVGPDDKDPDVVVVQYASPGQIGLPAKDYYTDADVLGKYQNTMSQIFEAITPKHKTDGIIPSRIRDIAHDVVSFEAKLAAASPDAEERNDVTKYYNPMTFEAAEELTPHLKLTSIVKSLAPTDFSAQSLIVLSPSYLANLSSILEETRKNVLHMYFQWKVIQAYSSAIEADEIKPYSRFSNELQGKDPESTPERWRTCVSHVDEGLGWILSRFFVEKAFSGKAKRFGDQIVSDIKVRFIDTLKKTAWMDKGVIDLAIDKVHRIVQKIGYPDKSPNITDATSLSKYYSSVTISASEFFENSLAMERFEAARSWSALGKPVDRNEWGMTVPTVNAYYNPPGNEIVFPAGIMQNPVFDVDVPSYLNYGAFGSVAGHELSHAFDSTGRHYDQNGNYTDWWTTDTVANFERRAECFVNQYSNITIPGPSNMPLHVNGRLTLGENIADAGGISAAFAAWKARRGEQANENLPGLDFFSQEQLFFVSYSNWWCGKSTKASAISHVYTDPHAPKWARVMGTMANSRAFKEAFNCPVKEPVCELW